MALTVNRQLGQARRTHAIATLKNCHKARYINCKTSCVIYDNIIMDGPQADTAFTTTLAVSNINMRPAYVEAQ